MREQVPTSNFFQRGGYERNPVAIRHNTVAKLLAVTDTRMDSNSNNGGARELAAAFLSSVAVMPREGGASSTPRPLDLRTAASGILDRPPSRTMTPTAWRRAAPVAPY